jgi:hypothetical protein
VQRQNLRLETKGITIGGNGVWMPDECRRKERKDYAGVMFAIVFTKN